jgi:carbon monoxide dehydrogenase subunit G
MKIEGEHVFHGSREQVWELVRDPSVLATALPGTQELEQLSDTEYAGSINLRVGPIGGAFSGKIFVEDETPPEYVKLRAEGEGKPGFFKGLGEVNLIDQGESTTLMQYSGDVQIGGKLASVGQRLIDTTSKSMLRQGFDVLDQALAARISGDEDAGDVEFTAPSETEFAASVAKDVAKETLSSSPVIITVIGIIILLAIVVWIFLV